ncbi:MAG: Rieske 2Fe-2S domain-containing protein [Candidatus Dormibacteria bacterium]
MTESLVDRIIRRQTWLERVADALQGAVGAVYGALGRPGRGLKNLMHGTVLLGHPLHPAISDLPIGAWAGGVVADYVAHFTTAVPTQAGDVALAFGLSSGVLAALTGLTDYHETFGHERRLATAHGLTMVAVVALEAASLGLRWWGSPSLHTLAVGLSTVGFVGVAAGGYLGGHLVFGIGTMVNRNAFAAGPDDYVAVGSANDFPEGELRRVQAAGMAALVVRQAGRLHAIAAVCSHAGGPLDEGTLEGTRVTCPWHGSVFSLESGRCLRGPATFDQPTFDIREREGRVELKLSTPGH